MEIRYCYLCNKATVYNYVCEDCQINNKINYRLVMHGKLGEAYYIRLSPSDSYHGFQRYGLDPDLQHMNNYPRYCYLCNAAMEYAYVCKRCQSSNGGKDFQLVMRKLVEFNFPPRTNASDPYYSFQPYRPDPDLQVDEGL